MTRISDGVESRSWMTDRINHGGRWIDADSAEPDRIAPAGEHTALVRAGLFIASGAIVLTLISWLAGVGR